MAPTTEAPKFSKKRKLGKGKKKAWRAAKIKDLEEFLDDERRQQETGGLVSEKADDKLFFVDTKKASAKKLPGKPISKENRRNRPLRSTALLEPNPNVKSPITPLKENYKKGKKTQKILDSINGRAASKVRVAAVQQRQNYVKEKIVAKKLKRQLPEVSSDIWNDDLMETAKVKRPRKLLGKPSKLPATVVPHPGASINPSYEDHQDLLQKAVEVEENKRKAALRTVSALQRPNRKDVATKETYLAEMSAGLLDDSESEDDDNEVDGTEDVQSSVRVPHRKTKRQRKAEARVGEQMRKKKAEADKNRRENMVFRLRSLKSDIRKQNVKTQEKLEKNIKLKEEEPFTTKRLGKLKYEEPAVELKLSEELVASMREFKPEGNLMEDVYKGMLRRNIMEPRSKQKKRKCKVKSFIRKSHKDVT